MQTVQPVEPNNENGICYTLIYSTLSNDSVSGQRRPRSDCADAQSDLGLRCPHLPKRDVLT